MTSGKCITCGKETQQYNDEFCSECRKRGREKKFDYNMIKGRMAETLIELLFLRLGFRVFRYGMENTIPEIMELLKGVRSDVAQEIRRMPDFVAARNNKFYFIEAKFRGDEIFTIDDSSMKGDYPYKNCFFIILSRKHIKCISYMELKEGKKITPESYNYLAGKSEFEFTQKDISVIRQFRDFAIKFFESV